MKIPIQKLKAMILYFASHTDPELLGKKKLMKLFYFSDFTHVKKYASPITHDIYVNLEHGPIPSTILNLVNTAGQNSEDSILGDTISIKTKDGSNMQQIVPRRQSLKKDEEYFVPSEINTLKEVCEKFKNHTGKSIEDASHKESAWLMTTETESIPYTLATNDPDCLVDTEDIETVFKIST